MSKNITKTSILIINYRKLFNLFREQLESIIPKLNKCSIQSVKQLSYKYIEDNDFRLFDTNNGLVHSWVSFNFKPNPLLALKLKVSHSSDHYSTTIVSGQLDNGSWIENPHVINENFNYRIQIDYAL